MSWEIEDAYRAGVNKGKEEGYWEGYNEATSSLETDQLAETAENYEWAEGLLEEIREAGEASPEQLDDLASYVAEALEKVAKAKKMIEDLQ